MSTARLLEKLEEARQALGGQVFDVLGKLQFEGRPLRDLLIEAIRYGDQPEVRARLTQAIEHARRPRRSSQDLLEERALAHDAMDASRVARVREDMERAEARRLQPHYIESFFLEAFKRLGGTVRQREPRRYEITHVPAPVRNRDRLIGIGEPVLPRYERIAFEKDADRAAGPAAGRLRLPGPPAARRRPRPHARAPPRPPAARHGAGGRARPRHEPARALLPRARHPGREPAARRASAAPSRSGCSTSRWTPTGHTRHLHYAPYLDYRPLAEGEPGVADLLARPECAWITRELEQKAQGHAIAQRRARAPRRGARPAARAGSTRPAPR